MPIKVDVFNRNTIRGLKDSLSHSERMINRFDPEMEDIQGRKETLRVINKLREFVEDVEDELYYE